MLPDQQASLALEVEEVLKRLLEDLGTYRSELLDDIEGVTPSTQMAADVSEAIALLVELSSSWKRE